MWSGPRGDTPGQEKVADFFHKTIDSLHKHSACRKPPEAESIGKTSSLWAPQTARRLLSDINYSNQIITNKSSEDNRWVFKCWPCYHLTATKQFFFKPVTIVSGLDHKGLESGDLPTAADCGALFVFCFSFAQACFPAVCPSVGFLNGLTTPSLEVLGQDICRFFFFFFFTAMENAHRD